MRWRAPLAFWGIGAGAAVSLFLSDVPIFQRDVLKKIPVVSASTCMVIPAGSRWAWRRALAKYRHRVHGMRVKGDGGEDLDYGLDHPGRYGGEESVTDLVSSCRPISNTCTPYYPVTAPPHRTRNGTTIILH